MYGLWDYGVWSMETPVPPSGTHCKSGRRRRASRGAVRDKKQIIQFMPRQHVHVRMSYPCRMRTILTTPKHFKSFSACLPSQASNMPRLGSECDHLCKLKYKPSTACLFPAVDILFSYYCGLTGSENSQTGQ